MEILLQIPYFKCGYICKTEYGAILKSMEKLQIQKGASLLRNKISTYCSHSGQSI